MGIAAGEYDYNLDYFRRMLNVTVIDVQRSPLRRHHRLPSKPRSLCDAHHLQQPRKRVAGRPAARSTAPLVMRADRIGPDTMLAQVRSSASVLT